MTVIALDGPANILIRATEKLHRIEETPRPPSGSMASLFDGVAVRRLVRPRLRRAILDPSRSLDRDCVRPYHSGEFPSRTP